MIPGANSLSLIVDKTLDNSIFFESKIKEHFSDMELKIVFWQDIKDEDFKASLQELPYLWIGEELHSHAATDVWLKEGLLEQSTKGVYSTSKFCANNRVLIQREKKPQTLFLFSQPDCAPCRSFMRRLNSHNVPFEKANERSILWHELNIQITPSFLWENRYFFTGTQGFKLTALKYILPSERA